MCTSQYLRQQIECLRRELAQVVAKKGFNNQETLKVSHELDRLLNLHERVRRNRIQCKK